MSFIVSGLNAAQFEHFFGKTDEELQALGARGYVADSHPGFPCRILLRDVDPGTQVILLNYAHLDVPTPYNSRHAIFVADGAQTQTFKLDHVPEILSIRQLISFRAFDDTHMMIDARVATGVESTGAIADLLSNAAVSYIHAHTAGRGCYLARIDRA